MFKLMQMLHQDFYITEFSIWSNQVVFISDKYGLIYYDESEGVLEFRKYNLRILKCLIEQAHEPAKYIKLQIASKENS